MKLSSWMMVPFLLALAGGAGCHETKSGAATSLTVSGPVDATLQAEGQRAVMIWTVSSGSPDYAYKFGEGTVTNGRFAITLPSDPPAEAVESFGIGIGIVMVLAPGVVLPDGKITTAFSAADILGLSTRGSVVWRARSLNLPDVGPPPGWWPLSFPVGYACGTCTPAPDAGGFDGFAPTSCDQIQINAYVQADVCNWT